MRQIKMKLPFSILAALMLLAAPAWSQATLTFEWDVVTQDVNGNSITGDVNYDFYICADKLIQTCNPPVNVLEGNQFAKQFSDGTYYVTVKAWVYLVVDPDTGQPLTDDKLSSPGFSNVVPLRVQVPPGNTANTRVRLIVVP